MAENNAVLSPEEKSRVKYHMGYLVSQDVLSLGLGYPVVTQPLFLVEAALNRIPQSAVGIFRSILARMDGIEAKMTEAPEYAVADELGEMKLAGNYLQRLEDHYVMWANRLSDLLGAPLNPVSARFHGGTQQPMNIRVVT